MSELEMMDESGKVKIDLFRYEELQQAQRDLEKLRMMNIRLQKRIEIIEGADVHLKYCLCGRRPRLVRGNKIRHLNKYSVACSCGMRIMWSDTYGTAVYRWMEVVSIGKSPSGHIWDGET